MHFILLCMGLIFSLSHSIVQASQLGVRIKQLAGATALLGGGSIWYSEHSDSKRYQEAVNFKLEGNEELRVPLSMYLKSAATKRADILWDKKERGVMTSAAPWFTLMTQWNLFKEGIPVKLGRTPLYVESDNSEDEEPLFITYPEATLKAYNGNRRLVFSRTFTSDNYALHVNQNIYEAAKNACNPFYRFKHDTVTLSSVTHAGYRIEAEMPNDLMQAVYFGLKRHEGEHVKNMIYCQEIPGEDISFRAHEIHADAGIRNPKWAQGAIAYFTLLKLERIYGVFNQLEIPEGVSSESFDEYLLHNYERAFKSTCNAYAHAQGKYYAERDFHPSEDERIAALKPRIHPGGTREIHITVLKPNGELHRTFILREKDGFAIKF